MLYTLFLLGQSAFVELLIFSVPMSHPYLRACFSVASLYVTAFCAGLSVLHGGAVGVCLAVFSLYRIFNIVRFMKRRMHVLYLENVTYRTSLILIACQFIFIGLITIVDSLNIHAEVVLTVALGLELVVAAVFLKTTLGHARRMRSIHDLPPVHDKDLPSVTIAIPARNETEDLEACLKSVVASQYPKLEILVLDDCSQSARTPEIIRDFAHDGVRFIKGAEPANGWLAKNQAYDALARSASGEIILFAGVDIRFEPNTVRRLVQLMVTKHKSMLCVMPQNQIQHGKIPLIQPMRYVWQLALPRKVFATPPVLSSCWLITRSALKKTGGFEAASRMVIPEMYLAKRQVADDGYSFIASGSNLGVSSVKNMVAQRATAIRTAYPSLHRRPESVALFTIAYLLWTILPALGLIGALLGKLPVEAAIISGWICAVNGYTYAVILRLAYQKSALFTACSLPLAALIYLGLLHYSMYKYEFSEVLWKGRNVCLPVMHVVPKLPAA